MEEVTTQEVCIYWCYFIAQRAFDCLTHEARRCYISIAYNNQANNTRLKGLVTIESCRFERSLARMSYLKHMMQVWHTHQPTSDNELKQTPKNVFFIA